MFNWLNVWIDILGGGGSVGGWELNNGRVTTYPKSQSPLLRIQLLRPRRDIAKEEVEKRDPGSLKLVQTSWGNKPHTFPKNISMVNEFKYTVLRRYSSQMTPRYYSWRKLYNNHFRILGRIELYAKLEN